MGCSLAACTDLVIAVDEERRRVGDGWRVEGSTAVGGLVEGRRGFGRGRSWGCIGHWGGDRFECECMNRCADVGERVEKRGSLRSRWWRIAGMPVETETGEEEASAKEGWCNGPCRWLEDSAERLGAI